MLSLHTLHHQKGSSDDEEYVDTSEESDNEEYDDKNKSKHYRRLRHYGPPNRDVYCSSKMITKIKIFQQQELGYVAPLTQKILLHSLLLSLLLNVRGMILLHGQFVMQNVQ